MLKKIYIKFFISSLLFTLFSIFYYLNSSIDELLTIEKELTSIYDANKDLTEITINSLKALQTNLSTYINKLEKPLELNEEIFKVSHYKLNTIENVDFNFKGMDSLE
jgi:O-antigen/teichoic acid export membrane protein